MGGRRPASVGMGCVCRGEEVGKRGIRRIDGNKIDPIGRIRRGEWRGGGGHCLFEGRYTHFKTTNPAFQGCPPCVFFHRPLFFKVADHWPLKSCFLNAKVYMYKSDSYYSRKRFMS